jgi:cytochrome c biogenesis protein CcmG/thiol:disulfide interchange protein DsbE
MTKYVKQLMKKNILRLSVFLIAFTGVSYAETIVQPVNHQIVNKEYLGEDWTLTSVTGEQVTLSEFKNQPVILVFWATWCPYCKKLLPGIAELNDKYEKKGLKVIAVNIKEDWKPDVYWKNFGYKFDAVLNGDDIAEMYGVMGTPGVVFIGPSGEVLKVAHFSEPNHPSLEKFAQHYLK